MPALLGVVLLVLLAGGCVDEGEPGEPSPAPSPSMTTSSAAPSPSSPSPSPSSPSPSPSAPAPRFSTWPLGERVLPRTAGGYGEIRPTPPSLRNRRYPTADLLPPPPGGRFAASVAPVTPAIRERMGTSYSPGCPVALADLRYVTVSFVGFDDAVHTGELVVAADSARDLVSVFRRLFRARFPIEEMRLPSTTDLEAPPTGDGNNTAAFVCRPTTGQTSGFSAHAYGLAIDVNPFNNPYLKGDLVLPERASAYLDRSRRRPGMIEPDDVVVRAFAAIGWSWGGDFSTLKDYQHFSATGR